MEELRAKLWVTVYYSDCPYSLLGEEWHLRLDPATDSVSVCGRTGGMFQDFSESEYLLAGAQAHVPSYVWTEIEQVLSAEEVARRTKHCT